MFGRLFFPSPVSARPQWLEAEPSDSPLLYRSGFLGAWEVWGGGI